MRALNPIEKLSCHHTRKEKSKPNRIEFSPPLITWANPWNSSKKASALLAPNISEGIQARTPHQRASRSYTSISDRVFQAPPAARNVDRSPPFFSWRGVLAGGDAY